MAGVSALETFTRSVAAAYGRPAWGASLGVGSFVTVEFGERRGERGEFHLWVYCCAWRIETADEVLACSEDPRDFLATAVPRLDGHPLTGVTVEQPSLSAAFSFGDELVLRTFSIYSDEYEHWMFYLPGGDVFTAGPGTTCSLGR
jgi:hypothetical protein